MLALAGVSAADAVGAALLYRLMSFWLPIPAGLVAAAVHRRRYGRVRTAWS
jgi:putative heme transporter